MNTTIEYIFLGIIILFVSVFAGFLTDTISFDKPATNEELNKIWEISYNKTDKSNAKNIAENIIANCNYYLPHNKSCYEITRNRIFNISEIRI